METLIAVDEDLGFDADDFVAFWNSEKGQTGALASKRPSQPSMFSPDIWLWLGRIADIIPIAGFVGLPTINELISKFRSRRPNIEEEIEIDVREGENKTYVRICRRNGRSS